MLDEDNAGLSSLTLDAIGLSHRERGQRYCAYALQLQPPKPPL